MSRAEALVKIPRPGESFHEKGRTPNLGVLPERKMLHYANGRLVLSINQSLRDQTAVVPYHTIRHIRQRTIGS